MKNIIYIVAAIILVAACKKSSNQAPIPTVTIGTQVWMLKNLDVRTYRNGDPIQYVSDSATWAGLTTGAWCWYNNDSATYGATYGKLYNWYAVNDLRGLAPAGFHIPSDAEWTTLSAGLGGALVAGGKMKETGTTHWATPNTEATNSSGFTALPGGTRGFDGSFFFVGIFGYWWSSSKSSIQSFALYRFLGDNNSIIYNDFNLVQNGFSVRCLRD